MSYEVIDKDMDLTIGEFKRFRDAERYYNIVNDGTGKVELVQVEDNNRAVITKNY